MNTFKNLKGTFILAILIALSYFSILNAQTTNYYALCVGVSNYDSNQYDLPVNITNDARDLQNYLVSYQGWNPNNIQLKINSDATKSNIISAINNLPNTKGNSELFFYSGHGSNNGLFPYCQTNLSPAELQAAFGSNYNQYCCIVMDVLRVFL